MDTRNVKDKLEEMMLGKEGVRRKEHKAQLERERELATIRAQSHALIWTGTAEELTEIIGQWYQAGRLVAENLQDALQKAAIHFAGIDGTLVLKPAIIKPAHTEPKVKETISRKAFVMPLLEAKGWSILEWANEAEVAPATAVDYLQEKTKPYRSTRLKLAKALGISVEQLPR